MDFRAALRTHSLFPQLLGAARGGTIADGLAMLRKKDPTFLRTVQSHREEAVAELYSFLPDERRETVAQHLGLRPLCKNRQPRESGDTPPRAEEDAVVSSLADVTVQRQHEQQRVSYRERQHSGRPSSPAVASLPVPPGHDRRCKVSIGPAELIGCVLGTSRQHIASLEQETGVAIHNWSDGLGLDTREHISHLWVEGDFDEHEVRYAVRRVEDHVANTIEKRLGPAAAAAVVAASAACQSQTFLTVGNSAVDLPAPATVSRDSDFPALQLAPSAAVHQASTLTKQHEWPDLPLAQHTTSVQQTTVVDESLFARDDSDDSDLAPDIEPEPEDPQEGPAAWELETARIRAEQAKKLAVKSEEEAAAAAVADGQAETEGDCTDGGKNDGSGEEELDELLEEALEMGRAMRMEMQREFSKGNLSRKMLRQRANDVRRKSKRYHGSALDPVIDEARNDEQALFRLIIEAEVASFVERALEEQDKDQPQGVGSRVATDASSMTPCSPSKGQTQGLSHSDYTRRGVFKKKRERILLKHSQAAEQMAPANIVGETIAARVMSGEMRDDGDKSTMTAHASKAEDSRWKRRLRMNKEKFS